MLRAYIVVANTSSINPDELDALCAERFGTHTFFVSRTEVECTTVREVDAAAAKIMHSFDQTAERSKIHVVVYGVKNEGFVNTTWPHFEALYYRTPRGGQCRQLLDGNVDAIEALIDLIERITPAYDDPLVSILRTPKNHFLQ